VETPDVIDLRKLQRKEPERQTEKQLYQVRTGPCLLLCLRLIYFCETFRFLVAIDEQCLFFFYLKVLEQKEERIAPGTLYGSSHTYVTVTLRDSSD